MKDKNGLFKIWAFGFEFLLFFVFGCVCVCMCACVVVFFPDSSRVQFKSESFRYFNPHGLVRTTFKNK